MKALGPEAVRLPEHRQGAVPLGSEKPESTGKETLEFRCTLPGSTVQPPQQIIEKINYVTVGYHRMTEHEARG